jgi:hypothetical protein
MSECGTPRTIEPAALLTKAEAARMARVSRRAIDNAIADGHLTVRTLMGRTWITRGSAAAFASWCGEQAAAK